MHFVFVVSNRLHACQRQRGAGNSVWVCYEPCSGHGRRFVLVLGARNGACCVLLRLSAGPRLRIIVSLALG